MKALGDVGFALVRFLDDHLRSLDTCERVSALASYCQGRALDGVRKSLVAMASRLEPDNVEGCRQRMHRALRRGRFSHQWAENPARRSQAEVPDAVQSATKAEIALAQLRRVREQGGPSMPVLADAGYGDSREFRESIERMDLPYLVAVSSTGLMWPPGREPQIPQHTGALGRPRSRARDPNGQVPVALATMTQAAWARGAFRPVLWGRGGKGSKEGSFCLLDVRSADGHTKGRPPSPPLQLLLERDTTQSTGFK